MEWGQASVFLKKTLPGDCHMHPTLRTSALGCLHFLPLFLTQHPNGVQFLLVFPKSLYPLSAPPPPHPTTAGLLLTGFPDSRHPHDNHTHCLKINIPRRCLWSCYNPANKCQGSLPPNNYGSKLGIPNDDGNAQECIRNYTLIRDHVVWINEEFNVLLFFSLPDFGKRTHPSQLSSTTIPVSPGLRGSPGYGTSSAKTRKVPSKLAWVGYSRLEWYQSSAITFGSWAPCHRKHTSIHSTTNSHYQSKFLYE